MTPNPIVATTGHGPISRWRLVARRMRKLGLANSSVYFLGRFACVRRLHQLWRSLFAPAALVDAAAPHTLAAFPVQEAIGKIARDGYYSPLRLQDEVLNELLLEASRTPGRIAHDDWAAATPEVLEQRRLSHEPALIVNFEAPQLYALADRVAADPRLIAVVSAHLGAAPRQIETRIQESLVAQANTEYRELRNQTVSFHYDVNALNFIYVFFYLTDTTRTSGAHELIVGSQRRKKLAHLFGSARRSDADIYDYYGRENARVIEGEAGSGFIEDTSCFHRALAPLEKPRLVLQVRYS